MIDFTFTEKHRKALRLEGVVILLLGILAILLPSVATLGIGLLIGVILLLAGLLKLKRVFLFRGFPGSGLSLIGALLLTAGGIALLVYPWEGLAVLTLILVVLFLFEAVGEMTYALQCSHLPAWGWIMASGVASLIIALLLLFHWPASAAWAVGLLVGINLLFTGTWLLVMSSTLKRVGGY
jgi:uncharacterized membrane protein HdeD (DUF308 family)